MNNYSIDLHNIVEKIQHERLEELHSPWVFDDYITPNTKTIQQNQNPYYVSKLLTDGTWKVSGMQGNEHHNSRSANGRSCVHELWGGSAKTLLFYSTEHKLHEFNRRNSDKEYLHGSGTEQTGHDTKNSALNDMSRAGEGNETHPHDTTVFSNYGIRVQRRITM